MADPKAGTVSAPDLKRAPPPADAAPCAPTHQALPTPSSSAANRAPGRNGNAGQAVGHSAKPPTIAVINRPVGAMGTTDIALGSVSRATTRGRRSRGCDVTPGGDASCTTAVRRCRDLAYINIHLDDAIGASCGPPGWRSSLKFSAHRSERRNFILGHQASSAGSAFDHLADWTAWARALWTHWLNPSMRHRREP